MTAPAVRDQFLRFLVVGGCGFLVDVGVFQAAMQVLYRPIPARLLSATVAITLTWVLNRRFVFGTAGQAARGPEYLRYLGVQAVGLVVNLGAFVLLVTQNDFFAQRPLTALCAGAALAVATNFLGSRYWAFRRAGGPAEPV